MSICNQIISTNQRICLAWIPSHIGLHGNEKADQWAKRALIYNIITPTPIAPKTLKTITYRCIDRYWLRIWRTHRFDKYRKSINRYNSENSSVRREEITLCRLRTGLTLITDILPRINRRHPDLCNHCGEILTIKHILIDCLLYYQERSDIRKYFREKQENITVMKLLKDESELTELLITYLRNTKLLYNI